MYAPGCSIQRLAELQAAGTRKRVAGDGWRKAGGGGRNHEVSSYLSLSRIFSAATATRYLDDSQSWC